MIARVWRGATRAEDWRSLRGLRRGDRGWRRRAPPRPAARSCCGGADGDTAEFVTILLFDSLDAVRSFAGDEIDRAVFFPEDDRYLVERDLDVHHYEVDAQIAH